MRVQPSFVGRSCKAPALIPICIALACAGPALAGAAQTDRTTLGDSIRDFASSNASARTIHDRVTVLRSSLTGPENDEPLEFSVAFKMQNVTEFRDRLERRETMSQSELDARFNPLASDYERVADWLIARGFTITRGDPQRLGLFVTGTRRQISAAFSVRFARVAFEGEEFSSAVDAPSVPSTWADAIVGINGLQPHIRPHRHSALTPYTPLSTTGNGPPYLSWQITRAYNADTITETGNGQKIAIVIDAFPSNSDLAAFWSACGIKRSPANIEEVQAVAGTLPPPSGEETLDAEWASAIAPDATIRIYATTSLSFVNIDAAYQQIIADAKTQAGLRLLSLSFGAGETYVSHSQMNTDSQYFSILANAGVTVFVASGDGGSSPGPGGHDHAGTVQVESPANDRNVTAVGGTSLFVDATTGNPTSETAWFDGGGGSSGYFTRQSWQTGAAFPTGNGRLVPDVAAVSDQNTGGYLILNGAAYIVGGTSWSAPVWAGFAARINQARAAIGLGSLGLLGPNIYPLNGSSDFRDITRGQNGSTGIYTAGSGFDLCTGLGVPDVALLRGVLAPTVPGLSMQATSQRVSFGTAATFSVVATGSAPFTYRWQISTDGGATWLDLADDATYSGTGMASLSIVNVGASFNGAQLRCVVNNAYGSIYSNAATLSVTDIPTDTPLLPRWAIVAFGGGLALLAVGRLNGPVVSRGLRAR